MPLRPLQLLPIMLTVRIQMVLRRGRGVLGWQARREHVIGRRQGTACWTAARLIGGSTASAVGVLKLDVRQHDVGRHVRVAWLRRLAQAAQPEACGVQEARVIRGLPDSTYGLALWSDDAQGPAGLSSANHDVCDAGDPLLGVGLPGGPTALREHYDDERVDVAL